MKNALWTLSIFLILCSCADEKREGNVHISGNINGLKKGTLYIQKLQDTMLVLLDSIKFDETSKFETEVSIESPEMLYLFLDRGETKSIDNNLMVFAEPGNITIDTDAEKFYANAKITGSQNHKLYQDFMKVKARLAGQDLDLTEKKLKSLQSKTPFSVEADKTAHDAILKKRYLYAINFALNNKNYEVAPFIALSEISDANLKYLDTINRSLTPEVAKSKYGKMLAKLVSVRKKENRNP